MGFWDIGEIFLCCVGALTIVCFVESSVMVFAGRDKLKDEVDGLRKDFSLLSHTADAHCRRLSNVEDKQDELEERVDEIGDIKNASLCFARAIIDEQVKEKDDEEEEV